jgi:hypothetical protein
MSEDGGGHIVMSLLGSMLYGRLVVEHRTISKEELGQSFFCPREQNDYQYRVKQTHRPPGFSGLKWDYVIRQNPRSKKMMGECLDVMSFPHQKQTRQSRSDAVRACYHCSYLQTGTARPVDGRFPW